jgi:GH15 family glucan-1,4-alpha-glucosidase
MGEYRPIADYAFIGDCHGAALVSRTGSIDWGCPRRFDAASIFNRILDAERGGFFSITPPETFTTSRAYEPGTMVLRTEFETAGGVVRVTDALAMRAGGRLRPLRQLMRVIDGIRGAVDLDIVLAPRFDYGTLRPWLHRHTRDASLAEESQQPESTGENTQPAQNHQRLFSAVGGDEAIVVSTDLPLEVDRHAVALTGTPRVAAGERYFVSTVWHPAHEIQLRGTNAGEVSRRLEETIAWWRAWSAKGHQEPGRYAESIERSALVLRALTTAPTGAIIAAPTTSLPESIGGRRNWDYRYCWVRDATFTLGALYAIGHHEVATGFRRFLSRAAAGSAEDMQVLYGCYGERRVTEIELPHLPGYRNSAPVRVGNAAADQRQLDVFGEFVGAIWVAHRSGDRIGPDTWHFVRSLIDTAASAWVDPDRGLWEVRGEPQHFLYSKVMCWLALDRGIQLATDLNHRASIARWTAARDAIRAAIYARGIDPTRGCFVQAFDSTELDASLLMLPRVGFIDANDPIMVATVAAIEHDLMVDGFVRRYRTESADDGVGGPEGVFLMCSFWLVDVLALQGRVVEAEQLFERLLATGNDVGLYAEQYDPASGEMLGNFPQAFTHVALINSARALREATRPRAD